MTFPGPAALGRGVVVAAGGPLPDGYPHAAPRIRVDDETLAAPRATVESLHRLWAGRRPHVVELAVAPERLAEPERTDRSPQLLGGEFTFLRERLFFLVWANTYDARDGTPVWWWGRKAERLGAGAGTGRDIRLADGREAWVDGGPRRPWEEDLGPVVHRESVEVGRLDLDRPSGPAAAADGLAPDQEEAVLHPGGAARIIAPAGSGKTRTMRARVRHLVEDRGWDPRQLCVVAYNVRAAAELADGLGRPDVTVRTLHSLGWEILREARGPLELWDERRIREVVSRQAPVEPRPNTDVIGPYLEAFSEIRIGLREPELVESERDDVPELATVYRRYRSALAEHGAADFDEQIHGAIEALCADPDLRRRRQLGARHVLVDEFQDLTPAYLLLVRLVASPALDVFGVGDDDQTIYGYAGATPGYLIDYERLFGGAVPHALEVNYRCPAAVVDAAATLLGYNRRRIDKRIRPADGAATDPDRLELVAVDEADTVRVTVDRIHRWLEDGIRPDRIAVLARVNSALVPVHAVLGSAGIPVRSNLGPGSLHRTAMAGALAWIRIGVSSGLLDPRDLREAVRRPQRGISRLLDRTVDRMRQVDVPALRRAGSRLGDRQRERWLRFCDDIELVRRVAAGGDTAALVRTIVDTVGLAGAARALDAGRTRADRASQSDDLKALVRAASHHADPTTFESWLAERLADPSAPDGVTLTTIHRVKGMEWERVVVYGADDGTMPHRLSDDVEEERRVFHVAVTRGADRVVVVADRDDPSPFLAELTGEAERRAEPAALPMAPPGPRPPNGITVEVGTELAFAGGFRGAVETIDPDGVSVRLDGGAVLGVRWGEQVETQSGRGPLRAPEAGAAPVDEGLLERLKAWRTAEARRRKVSAFIVAHDATLERIARARPQSMTELAAVDGIGPARLDQYGDALLELCADAD